MQMDMYILHNIQIYITTDLTSTLYCTLRLYEKMMWAQNREVEGGSIYLKFLEKKIRRIIHLV